MKLLSLANFIAVLIFGATLSLSFADISMDRHKRDYAVVSIAFSALQILAYASVGKEWLFKLYPLLIHIPLFLLLKYHYKRSGYIAAIAVLSAYLFCTPRKWIGTAVSALWGYDSDIAYLVQLIVTLPLLLLILRFLSPHVRRLKYESDRILRFFIIVPLIYYGFEYALTVYTDLLYTGSAAIMEFMDSSIVVMYFLFSVLYLKALHEKKESEMKYAVSNIMTSSLEKELQVLRKSERQMTIYRHDIRHHMNYLQGCIAENKLQDAAAYIRQTCEAMDHMRVKRYSANEPLNLIFSSYAGQAEERGIQVDFRISADDFERFQLMDLCSLLSNCLENAIHACEAMETDRRPFITLRMYEKNCKLCLHISNSCKAEPAFEQGVPVSRLPGHGIGVKSILYVIEKYQGVCRFSAADGVFTFQASL